MRHIAFLCASVLAASSLWADAIPDTLEAPTQVLDGMDPIDVSVGHATPYVIDWDGDGKKDLLVGQFDGGKLRIYLNRGTDEAPSFSGYTFLQADGADAASDAG